MDDFVNVLMPSNYSYGATFGPRFKVNKTIGNSGKEKRNADWKEALWEINVSYDNQTVESTDLIEEFFLQAGGGLTGFLFELKKGNVVNKERGIANEDGILKGYPYFSLYYIYNKFAGFKSYKKRIFKPKPDAVKIYNNGVVVNWEVDYEHGVVKLPAILAGLISNISKEINAKITSINHQLRIGDKVYISGVVGLSNAVYTITQIVDVDNFRINLNTTDLLFGLGEDTKFEKFINGDENIQWEGEFYLPVRFKEDSLLTSFDDYNATTISVSLVELRMDEEYNKNNRLDY